MAESLRRLNVAWMTLLRHDVLAELTWFTVRHHCSEGGIIVVMASFAHPSENSTSITISLGDSDPHPRRQLPPPGSGSHPALPSPSLQGTSPGLGWPTSSTSLLSNQFRDET